MNRSRDLVVLAGLFLAAAFIVAPASAVLQDSPTSQTAEAAKAIFAGGCFWCMEEAFEKVEGVSAVVSGYVGGTQENPTYEQVSSGRTRHFEGIEVLYDPAVVSYSQLLEVLWRNIDPTDGAGQFCDKGLQYRTAIFYGDEEEKRLSEESKKSIEASKPFPEAIVTPILPHPCSTRPRDTIRITTRRTPSATNTTNGVADALRGWKSSGAQRTTSTSPSTLPSSSHSFTPSA